MTSALARWRATWLLWPALLLLVLFFIWPTLDVARASLFDPDFTLRHFERLVTRSIYATVLLRTLWVALEVAVLCTLIGYPAAWIISRQPRQRQVLLLFALFVTMWMSVLIRSFAWVVVFGREGVVNGLLLALGLASEPQQFLYTSSAVLVAMVQVLLPIQIVTCVGAMTEIDSEPGWLADRVFHRLHAGHGFLHHAGAPGRAVGSAAGQPHRAASGGVEVGLRRRAGRAAADRHAAGAGFGSRHAGCGAMAVAQNGLTRMKSVTSGDPVFRISRVFTLTQECV